MVSLEILLFVLLFIWIIVVSYYLYLTRKHYQELVKTTGKEKLDQILSALLKKEEENNNVLREIRERTHTLEIKNKNVFQKIGFKRFNPFERVAGDQSFIFSLLDAENSGIILNFIYTREGIRVYGKKVKKGISEEHELSKEEKEVITQTKSNY